MQNLDRVQSWVPQDSLPGLGHTPTQVQGTGQSRRRMLTAFPSVGIWTWNGHTSLCGECLVLSCLGRLWNTEEVDLGQMWVRIMARFGFRSWCFLRYCNMSKPHFKRTWIWANSLQLLCLSPWWTTPSPHSTLAVKKSLPPLSCFCKVFGHRNEKN